MIAVICNSTFDTDFIIQNYVDCIWRIESKSRSWHIG